MYQYIAKRLLLVIPTLFGAAVLVFLLLRLIPGDICDLRLGGEGGLIDQETLQHHFNGGVGNGILRRWHQVGSQERRRWMMMADG